MVPTIKEVIKKEVVVQPKDEKDKKAKKDPSVPPQTEII